MPNTPLAPLVFYPSYCFGLSPTYEKWVRLTATDVHALESRRGFEGQDLYFFNNHPIKWIRLVGVIVAFDVYPNRITMTLDDSSGLTVEIFCKKDTSTATPGIDTSVDCYGGITLNKALAQKKDEYVVTTFDGEVNLRMFDVGSVVKIKGGISEFRDEKQVTLQRISLVRTTNEEAAAWVENAAFRTEVLCKPWVVSERQQALAKKKAAGLDKEREAKKERKRKRRDLAEKRKCGPHKDHGHQRGVEKKREQHPKGRMPKPKPIEAARSYRGDQA